MPNIPLIPPNNEKRILLHSCCAPCSGSIVTRLKKAGIECTIIFYNPNIQPQEEYEMRKAEQIRYAKKFNVTFVDLDYDPEDWHKAVSGLENEPERGKRCQFCFEMRLERSALFAHENQFHIFTSTLGLSRFKDLNQVNLAGQKAASRYPDLIYWDLNWRKGSGSQDMYKIAKDEQFYKQEYCGCQYSLKQTNEWRQKSGKPPISQETERLHY